VGSEQRLNSTYYQKQGETNIELTSKGETNVVEKKMHEH
jgi:hypothetical protein